MDLKELGWTQELETEFSSINTEGIIPGRVIAEHKNIYIIAGKDDEYRAELSGRYWYDLQQICEGKGSLPAVGDWVVISHHEDADRAQIHGTLKRRSKFSRKMKITGGRKLETFEHTSILGGGRTEEQIVAVNIDNVVLVLACDTKLKLGLVERFLTTVWESGADPLIILNKIDLDEDWRETLETITVNSMGAPVIALSAVTSDGLRELDPYLGIGKTIALIGKSGVGKSTLINRLLGDERQRTGDVRITDSKGKHTTTYRELIVIPGKGLLLDTPGMREMQLWSSDESVQKTFSDIEKIMTLCRFRNCSHHNEPGCAVIAALEDGSLTHEHYQSYLKQKREMRYLERKQEERRRKLSRKVKKGTKVMIGTNRLRIKK